MKIINLFLDYRLATILFLAGFMGEGKAQTSTDLPKIIWPSPEAASLFRYSDYPVDRSTGLPEISIPLYEIKSGSLSVPISLSYHASGRRVNDQDGAIALGWMLNAGGMISRTIYGSADFGIQGPGTYKFPYPFNTTNLNLTTDYKYLEKINHFVNNPMDVAQTSWMDSEYDLFSYSFGSNSGKFIFKDSNSIKTPVLLPYKPFLITPTYDQFGLTQIDILDDKGVLYQFAASEFSQVGSFQPTTGYSLSRIISADKADTITFLNQSFQQTRTSISQNIVWNDKDLISQTGSSVYVPEYTNNEITNRDPYTSGRLMEIDFRQGKVVFNMVGSTYQIDNIKIMDKAGNTIKTIQLTRSPMDNMSEESTSTSKLSTVAVKDNAGNTINTYLFDYYPTVNPTTDPNAPFNVRFRDWWGYYNASNVHDMVPYYTNLEYVCDQGACIYNNYTIGNSGAIRTPNLAGAESGVLRKVTFPTGGSTEFIYESNQYYSFAAQQVRTGPGLRIARMNTRDSTGNIHVKTYKYGVNESGYGTLDLEPDITTMATESTYNYYTNTGSYPDVQGSYRQRIFYSDFLPELADLAARPVVYSEVAEYDGDATDNIGKTVYDYDYAGWAPSAMPSFESMTIQRKHIYNYNYWNTPSLIKQSEYKRTTVNNLPSYVLKRQINNTYTSTTTAIISGLHVQRVHQFPQDGTVLGTYPPPALYTEPFSILMGNPAIKPYTYSDYQISAGYKNLSSTSESTYNDDNTVVTTGMSYSYNAQQYINQTTRTASDGLAVNTTYTYPFDYSGNTVLSQMVSANMLNYPVEQSVVKNTQPISSVRTNYFNYGSANLALRPLTVDTKKGSNAYETRLRYYAYDKYGNPLTVSKELGVHISYIWDYQSSYPIAQCTNADTADIAYTSFEADGKGRWTFAGTPTVDANARTGGYSYGLSSGQITRSGLNTSKTFIVSYWSKAGSATVNGATATGLFTSGGWTYFEHKLPANTASVTVSGSVTIDELRLYPSNAQMITSTFTPLVGVTSQCDVSSNLMFYDYDSFGRLKQVRDINGNIIKTYKYHDQSDSVLP